MKSYRGYRNLVLVFPLVLIGYTAVALSDLYLPGFPRHVSGEIFPFFNWDLFSTPWQRGKLITIHVRKGEETDPIARDLIGKTMTVPDAPKFLRDPRFQKIARELELAYRRKHSDLIQQLKPNLDNFLRPYGIQEYDLVILRYDPVAFYRGEEAAEEQFVASLRVEGLE